jgi:hypothetical protein
MRNAATAFLTALVNARETGIVPRKFLWVRARDRDTDEIVGFGLWTGDDDVDVTLRDGQTGATVVRLYLGMGTSLVIPAIPMVSDLTVQTVRCEMSQLNDAIQQMVRGYDVRLAKVDIHEGLLSPDTRQLVSAPEIAFLGEVDGAPVETPAAGGQGKISLEIVSDAIRMLTRTNPRKRSYEGQKRRSGDEFGRYANAVASWTIPWGELEAGAAAPPAPAPKKRGIFSGL